MTHPYLSLPETAYWKRSVSGVDSTQLDPVVTFPFKITPEDRIATAGSCFAQHLSNRLQCSGFNFYVTEPAPPFFLEDMARAYGYGVFSARYGNVYTTHQLLQLFQRAYGLITADDDYWLADDGSWIDPFRPRIQEGNFASEAEYRIDREQHYQAVREMFEQLDVFVFTLGLTESWQSQVDGMVYPLCPGVAGGTFDANQHRFVNVGVEGVTAAMLAFIDLLRSKNPSAKIILTVSPVPLIATCVPQHVLVSNTYSKAVLRVSCEQICAAREQVAYFPSYEIITGSFNRGGYFADDLRSVTEAGVDHVMRLFMAHCTTHPEGNLSARPQPPERDYLQETAALLEVLCDEEVLDIP